MKGKNLKERGITLIALVITIIVLLILAGVTISIVLHTGIIDNSQKAVDLYEANAKNEVKQLDDLTLKIQTQFGILDNTEGKENQTITGDKNFAYNNPVIPVGFKTSNEGASWKSSDGKTVDGWNSGLVIEDKDGNQFVWVPCYIKDKENDALVEYKKTLGQKDDEITDLNQVQEDDLPEGINEESQIETYKGFYIARYEAGIPETMEELLKPSTEPESSHDAMTEFRSKEGIPVSKKNQVPWNSIDYTKAKANAESMYTGDKVKSGLLTGKMWDTTLAWLEKTNAVKKEEIYNDSTSWGNYKTSIIPGVTSYSKNTDAKTGLYWEDKIITKPGRNEDTLENNEKYVWLLKTGNTEYTKRNNIYDLAGNLWEWTYEKKQKNENSFNCVLRGGDYFDVGSEYQASFRYHFDVETSRNSIGFRVGLYIM